jgi:hypothetical protein
MSRVFSVILAVVLIVAVVSGCSRPDAACHPQPDALRAERQAKFSMLPSLSACWKSRPTKHPPTNTHQRECRVARVRAKAA